MEKGKQSRPAEFVVHNPENLVHFYEKVFGYRVLDIDPETGHWAVYRRVSTGNGVSEVSMKKRTIKQATSFIINLPVDSLEYTTETVIKNGGTIYIETEAEGEDIITTFDLGRQRFFCDPEGNMFGAVEYTKEIG